MKWQIVTVPEGDKEKLQQYLDQGWQPFAVHGGHIYLKRRGYEVKG